MNIQKIQLVPRVELYSISTFMENLLLNYSCSFVFSWLYETPILKVKCFVIEIAIFHLPSNEIENISACTLGVDLIYKRNILYKT